MGSCCAKKDNDERLLPKGSLDYAAVSTNINWEAIDDMDKSRKSKHENQDNGYVAIDDDEVFQQRLSRIGKFDQNGKTRSRQSSLQQNSLNSTISINLEESEYLRDWKPHIIKTYNVELKAIKDLDNKSLLSLLKLYEQYFDKNMTKEQKLSLSIEQTTTPSGEEEGVPAMQRKQELNENAYAAFLSLYNWFEKEVFSFLICVFFIMTFATRVKKAAKQSKLSEFCSFQ